MKYGFDDNDTLIISVVNSYWNYTISIHNTTISINNTLLILHIHNDFLYVTGHEWAVQLPGWVHRWLPWQHTWEPSICTSRYGINSVPVIGGNIAIVRQNKCLFIEYKKQ